MSYLQPLFNMSLLIILFLFVVLAPLIAGQVIASNCTPKCGNITIPYPFGVEDGCFFNDHTDNISEFKIRCINNQPVYGQNIEVIQISLEPNEIHMKTYISTACYSGGILQESNTSSVRLNKFRVSGTKNVLVGMGCDTYVWFSGIRKGKRYDTGCMTICNDFDDVVDGGCNGIGCCEASLRNGISLMNTTIGSFSNHSYVNFNPCSAAFAIAKDAFKFHKSDLNYTVEHYRNNNRVPVVYNWGIGNKSCADARAHDEFLCKKNTDCDDSEDQVGYRCNCKKGFSGNPYLPQGCTDINECSNKGMNNCEKPEYCVNTEGGFTCICPKGFHGNATENHPCSPPTPKTWLIPVLATAGIGAVIITILVIGFIWHWKRGQRQLKEMQKRCFRQNGGDILKHLLYENGSDLLTIFTLQDLAKATNNFSVKNIVGKGGFGIVYKGFLSDNNPVAIKKSIKVDPDQVDQFVNEILTLSKIKHANVVRLLGCCLEDEVPLLVYEFINNATLYRHLHDDTKATTLTWSRRLQIAFEVADALCHLHHELTQRIVHRDMKTMNILLDHKYTAKVADFGASRLVPFDQRRVSLKMLGTWGYLDPEYMQTCELTEKSDVYSFGVVLLELLMRKEVVSEERPEKERFLANHFFVKVNEGHLHHILDKNIEWNESTFKEAEQVANLAKSCLKYRGEDRPTMKEISTELRGMLKNITHPWKKDDSQIREDCESLISSIERSDYGGCNSGNDSTMYNLSLKSSLEIGR